MKKTVLPFQSRYKAHERQDSRTVPLSAEPLSAVSLSAPLSAERAAAGLPVHNRQRTYTDGWYQADERPVSDGLRFHGRRTRDFHPAHPGAVYVHEQPGAEKPGGRSGQGIKPIPLYLIFIPSFHLKLCHITKSA